MNINASIIDQRLVAIVDEIKNRAEAELHITDTNKLKSLAFVYLCVKIVLDLDTEEAFDCLTEGGGDFGVDAIHVSEEYDGEFTVSLFQGKYKRNLDGNANFPENAIIKIIDSLKYLLDPNAELQYLNPQLESNVEEIRSLIRDGYLPQVRVFACNNGLPWQAEAQTRITRENFADQVLWEHINHDRLIKILQTSKSIKAVLRLSGAAIVEDMNFSRVLVGRIAVTEIANLIEQHGERLLERNIRRYLGLMGNRVNEGIRQTLLSEEQDNFYFYNNGITLTCDNFAYNGLQSGDFQVRVENLQIINGGQTCMTIFRTLQELRQRPEQLTLENSDAVPQDIQGYVLLRLYQLPSDNESLVQKITYATNSQNPVDLRDLRANDERQKRLELDIEQLGFQYRRKRTQGSHSSTEITSGVAAQAVLSVWRQRPHQAKFLTREHFGKLYDLIFTDDLNGSQVILAVQLYRMTENRRKRPRENDPNFVRYASCFMAMQMGKRLSKTMGLQLENINHTNFSVIEQEITQNQQVYIHAAIEDIQNALERLYNSSTISWQQLAATFRRGDLISILPGN